MGAYPNCPKCHKNDKVREVSNMASNFTCFGCDNGLYFSDSVEDLMTSGDLKRRRSLKAEDIISAQKSIIKAMDGLNATASSLEFDLGTGIAGQDRSLTKVVGSTQELAGKFNRAREHMKKALHEFSILMVDLTNSGN